MISEKNPIKNSVYIGERISVGFDKPLLFTKKPKCPDEFTWREKIFNIIETLSEWQDFTRKGKNSRNMKDAHLERAKIKGSLGVGRFYFRVRTNESRVFDIYYDRSIKNVQEKVGYWELFQELFPD